MYIMKTSKEFASLNLTVNEVIKGLNKYFDGPSTDNVRFYSAEMDYTYYYSPKCCLAVAILWLHEQGVDYSCGMSLPCEEGEKKKAKTILVKVNNVISTDIRMEPDSLPELDVKMALWDGTFDNVQISSICEDLIHYISKYGEDTQDDDEDDLCEHELELLDLKKKIVLALGISLSDRKIAIDDPSKLHDFSYLIKLIEYTSMLLNKANAKCTELEDRLEKAEDKQKELTDQYSNLRTDLIDVLGIDRDSNDSQLLCKVSRLYYFRREVQRKLDCLGYSDENTMAVLLKIIDNAKCFDNMNKRCMETTNGLCEIAEIIRRLQK